MTFRVYFRLPSGRITSVLNDASCLPSVARGSVLLAVCVVAAVRVA